MYDKNQTEASKGAIIELNLALGQYEDDYVLTGGWTPYFLSKGHFDHCGSIDIDLVFSPEIMIGYESISEIIQQLGYTKTDNPFRYEREISALDGTPFSIHIDVLTEPEAEKNVRGLISVQDDLQGVFIRGCSIVFKHNYLETVEALLPDGSNASSKIRTADIVSTLTLKGLALGRAGKIGKDSYDIYAVSGFHEGDPERSALKFQKKVLREGGISDITSKALEKIRAGFKSSNSYASNAVARFMEVDVSVDASERVSAFFETLDL